MPEIKIRPAIEADIPHLIAFDHSYVSDYVWQMEIIAETGRVGVEFRETHLPRSVRVDYPRHPRSLTSDWDQRGGLLVALLEEEILGYISMETNIAPVTTWVTDLVVVRRFRRQGIGSALVLAGQDWGRQRQTYRMILEMQPKNYPGIHLAEKLGFDFCGYNDRYYTNHDIGLFFTRSLR